MWPTSPRKYRAFGDKFDNGTRNIIRCREAAKNRERLEQVEASQIEAQIVLVRAALAQHRLSAAQEALARATTLSPASDSGSPSNRLRLATCAARVNSAAGNSASALPALRAALDDLGPKATLPIRLEARLAVAEITLASSGAASARPLLDALEKDATEKGFALYARKADALRKT